jgi:Cu(I)/Ag(I) efflux system membrane fusion protein
MKKILPILLLALFISVPVLVQTSMAQGETQNSYICPMHPHYGSDHEGTCPICGMNLTKVEMEEEESGLNKKSSTKKTDEKKILYWVAPMDPNYKMDKAGKSPMGMDLVPVYAEEDTSMDNMSGRSIVKISPEMIQNSGVRSEPAQMSEFGASVRSYGDITENTRDQFDISARVEGWVEKLNVQAEGDIIKKGELILTLYSPRLVSSQNDLISALRSGNSSIARSAAKRLQALGMQKRAINEVKKRRKAFENVPFYAENDGIVSEIKIREGVAVRPAMTIISLQNYDTVWLDVSVAEKDISFITKDSKASVSFPTLGISDINAKIDYIYPTIDRATRTGRVRLVMDNADGVLKPGAYADVEFLTNAQKRLSIPSEAILKSKNGDFVVVNLGEGRFQPRKVQTGLQYQGKTEITDGLSMSDDVVVSGQFLIDSESALRDSFRKMAPVKKDKEPAAIEKKTEGNPHAGH